MLQHLVGMVPAYHFFLPRQFYRYYFMVYPLGMLYQGFLTFLN